MGKVLDTLKKVFSDKIFKTTILAILVVEIFSLLSYLLPWANQICFAIILILALYLSIKKPEYGLYFILTELFIGSKGYLFYINLFGFPISIRLGLFLIVFGAFVYHFIKNKELAFAKSKLFYPYLVLLAILLAGTVIGYLNKNSLSNIFLDFNAFLYFGLAFVFYQAIKDELIVSNIIKIFFACLFTSFIKVSFILYIFSHNISGLIIPLYRWIRLTGIGEITPAGQNFYRIFFQSQIYAVIGFFLLVSLILFRKNIKAKELINIKSLAVVALFANILISFSRSFWFSILLTFILLAILLIAVYKYKIKQLFIATIFLISILILSVGYFVSLVKFPIPEVPSGFSADLLTSRFTSISGEAGVSSRWNQLPVLLPAIKNHPFFGSGFGSVLTYKSLDPRILETKSDGMYTTYAFEWGYLDLIYKIGIFGLLIYLYFIWIIIKMGYQAQKKCLDENKKAIIWGLLLGIAALLFTHNFSPYLNHPLGIGYILISGCFFEYFLNASRLDIMKNIC